MLTDEELLGHWEDAEEKAAVEDGTFGRRAVYAAGVAAAIKAVADANVLTFKPVWGSNEHDMEVLRFGDWIVEQIRQACGSSGSDDEAR